jgi:predicted Zn finger-like uncharacterized protein
MIITCNECETSFNLDANLISENGTKVRCSKCRHVFTAYPTTDAVGEDLQPEISGAASDELTEEMSPAEAGLQNESDADLENFLDEGDLAEAGDGEADFSDDDLGLPEIGDLQSMDEMEDDAGQDDVMETAGGGSDPDEDLPVIDGLTDMDKDLESVELGDGSADDAELDLDFNLDDLVQDDETETEAFGLAMDTEEPGLNDHELDVEELTPEAAEPTAGDFDAMGDEDLPAESDEDELDLSDIEAMLEEDQDLEDFAADEAADDGLHAEDALEMEDAFEMDFEADAEDADSNAEATGSPEEVDELDLEDFEAPEAEEVDSTFDGDGDQEIELDLDMDLEDDDEMPTSVDAGDSDGELDFSDLESMLSDEDEEGVGDEVEDLEMDLEFDEPAADADSIDEDDELFDIEKVLEESEAAGASESPSEAFEAGAADFEPESEDDDAGAEDGDDIELDFDLDGELEEPQEAFQNEELEFNLLEGEEDTTALAGAAAGATAGAASAVGSTTDDFATEEFTDTGDLDGATDMMAEEADHLPEIATTRTRSRKPLVLVLLLLVVIAGVLIVPRMFGIKIPYVSDLKIPYLSDMNLEVPFLSGLIGSGGGDEVGNLKITPLGKTITAKFVDNENAGRLFVVKGQLRNEYGQPRSFIRVTGKLFRSGGQQAAAATVYAGNSLSASELKRLDMSAINKRLQNKFGDQKANVDVKTGRVIPFMVVFDKTPEGLEEYTVEVAGSTGAGK